LRYSLIAAYCWLRAQEITDDLIESLIQIIHRLGATAEHAIVLLPAQIVRSGRRIIYLPDHGLQ
jgi:hypothetical protein